MITEDYCSYEIAKMLKEKGFDGECRMKYRVHDKSLFYHVPNPNDVLQFTIDKKWVTAHSKKNHCDYILAPTHQMAMKWLREVEDCPIEILWHYDGDNQCDEWHFVHHMELRPILPCKYYDTYEQAVEAALKYCLEELI